MALIDPAFAASLDPTAMDALLKQIAGAIGGVDMLDLDAMPVAWAGIPSPIAAHPAARPARTHVGALALEPDFAAVLAAHRGAKKSKKHRWQINALAPVGGYRFRRAASEAEALAILNAYFTQKAAWFRAQGIADSFTEPGIADFFKALVERRWQTGESVIELDAIEFNGGIHAILGSGTAHGRLSGYFLSVADDEWRRVSPGELLIHDLVAASCERGLASLDLGRGDERYKTSWLDPAEPHVRLLLPITVQGRLALSILSMADRAESAIRRNPRLFRLAKTMRRWRGGKTGPAAEAATEPD
jgi:CelD/BcsL family acetyltransferase involved in cellulose biosynthesis